MNAPLSERALERRLKRHFRKTPQHFFAPCAPGFEDVLEAELKALPDVTLEATERGGVAFRGPPDTVYHANLWLRSAHRVLLRLDDFLAPSYPVLFDRASRIAWELYLGFETTYSIHVSAKTSRLRHHKNIVKTLSDAISAQLNPLGLNPVQGDGAELELHVRMFRDRCTLSINTSGTHLHKRGYRSAVTAAPLRETLAASILMTCNLSDYDLVYDPMCGSGTLPIEAALLATRKAPGGHRGFAFEHMPSFQKDKWERLRREALAQQRRLALAVIGGDIDEESLHAARSNAARAGIAELVHFHQQDATTYVPAPEVKQGLLVSNLPYGERLGNETGVAALLEVFARHLARHYQGWRFAFVTRERVWPGHPAFAVSATLRFNNGGLPVNLIRGEIKTPR